VDADVSGQEIFACGVEENWEIERAVEEEVKFRVWRSI